MLECDYPHSDSAWPDTAAMANKWLGDLPEDVQHKITIGNAERSTPLRPTQRRSPADGLLRPGGRTPPPRVLSRR